MRRDSTLGTLAGGAKRTSLVGETQIATGDAEMAELPGKGRRTTTLGRRQSVSERRGSVVQQPGSGAKDGRRQSIVGGSGANGGRRQSVVAGSSGGPGGRRMSKAIVPSAEEGASDVSPAPAPLAPSPSQRPALASADILAPSA